MTNYLPGQFGRACPSVVVARIAGYGPFRCALKPSHVAEFEIEKLDSKKVGTGLRFTPDSPLGSVLFQNKQLSVFPPPLPQPGNLVGTPVSGKKAGAGPYVPP
jgi:hypothetical protein